MLMMRLAVLGALVLILFGSCNIKPIVPVSITEVKFNNIDPVRGLATFDMCLVIDNPNNFSVKIHEMDMDVKVADIPMGKVHIDEKLKIKRKSKLPYKVSVSGQIMNVILNIPKLLQALSTKKADVAVAGKVTAGALGVKRTFEVSMNQPQVKAEQNKPAPVPQQLNQFAE
jgi:LEA14-like dessication related protein